MSLTDCEPLPCRTRESKDRGGNDLPPRLVHHDAQLKACTGEAAGGWLFMLPLTHRGAQLYQCPVRAARVRNRLAPWRPGWCQLGRAVPQR